MSRILVVDDEPAIGWSLREMLADEGYDVALAANVDEALAAAGRAAPDAVLLDVRLPGRDGIDAIPDLRAVSPGAPIVVMTAFGDLETAVRAVRAGAFDFLVKPFDLENVSTVVARAVAGRDVDRPPTAADVFPPALIGSSAAMQELFRQIAAAAASDLPALVTGPRGSGADHAALAIHVRGPRRDRPFVATNLAALAPATISDELFGGDATPGLVQRAAGGTLLVEEIEAAPPDAQVRLATLAEHRAAAGDVRLIVSTSRSPATSGLHPHLASHLRSLVVTLPPLADRRDDVPAIVHGILALHAAAAMPGRPPAVTPEFLAAVQARDWPGDVRDLKAAVEHAAIVARGEPLRAGHLPAAAAGVPSSLETASRHVDAAIRDWAAAARAAYGQLPEPDLHNRAVRLVEATLLREALAHTGGNRTAAARLLGLDRATLRTRLRHLGLDD